MDSDLRRDVLTWLALLVLLALTAGSAWLDLGGWNSTANLAIAAVKVALVAWRYMELRRPDGLLRAAGAAALAILGLLLALSAADYATRTLWRAPWQTPAPVAGTASAGFVADP